MQLAKTTISSKLTYQPQAEDTILQKLRWGEGSQSEKQWRDVLGILKLQAEGLDYTYLTQWAESLNLVDVLSQAFTAAGM